jgi:hypothetical protein
MAACGAAYADASVEKRTPKCARVFIRVLEHKGPGKLVARTGWRIDSNSAVHTAMIDPAGSKISTMEDLIWV